MLNLEFKEDKKTPYVKMTDELLILKGRSHPENSLKFYKPMMNFLNESEVFENYEVNIDLEYINTSSIKSILYLLNKISEKTVNQVKINWMIDEDDEGMIDISDLFKTSINNVEIKKIIK
jgi:hypothetical protein